MEENELMRNILREAKIGWWEVDMRRKVIFLSDFLKKSIGISENKLSFDRFEKLICDPYRTLIANGKADNSLYACEQVFPLRKPGGEVWFRWKLIDHQMEEGVSVKITGYAQRVASNGREDEKLFSVERMNSLLYRLNTISHTLLTFLHADTIDQSVEKVLIEIQKMFRGSRVYIVEFDWETKMHVSAYEVTDKGVGSAHNEVSRISMEQTPWWIDQLSQGNPIILSELDDLPPEAFRERELLARQGIDSLFVLPLMMRDKLWGYAGIDVVGESRTWQNEDYQWFASLVNIVHICIGLQRSEHEAQTERDYLQSLYHYMPLGYIRLKLLYDWTGNPVNYVVLDSNDATDAIIDRSRASYVGKTASELGGNFLDYMPLIIKTLQTDHYVETDSTTVVGKRIHAVLYSTHQDEVICLLTDTTEMHATHEALNRSEKLLRNIYDNIPVGIELYDKKGVLVDINKKDMEIFGIRNKEDLPALNFFDNPIVTPETIRRVRDREEFTFKLYYPFDRVGNYYPTAKTGYIEIYTSVSMLYDTQGELENFMLINIDNTEINRAHSRIAEFESSFSLVSRFGKVGYCRFDLLAGEGYALPQWYCNLGEKPDTPLSRVIGVYTYVAPEDRKEVSDSIRKVRSGKIDSFSHDLRIQVDGEVKWTRINVIRNPMNNDPSKIEMVCVNYDITELKETERSLIQAKEKAEVSDRLKSAFLANMSHEIRTPLNAIVGFSNLLMETNDALERREYINIVQENNDLLLKLISDILDLSKIEAGTLEFNNAEFDVNQMCREIVRSLSIKVGDKPVELRFGAHLAECRLVSDKNRLTQVLSNFVNNALKFTQKGFITLSCRCDDGENLTFSVEDTGAGIPDQELESVFGRFVKLNNFSQGTGLGLAICKSIVKQWGGHIGVTSREGKGSCFWFTHPYIRASELSDSEIPEPPQVRVLDGRRPLVLIAEDTESNFLLLSLTLRKEYEVLRASDGFEAVRLAADCKPDLILMDIQMPGIDGLEATQRIRRENPSVPIIAITAFAYDRDRQRALEAGCNDYLSKPVAGEVLRLKLRSILRG